jgi:hypothetical protein
VQHPVAALAVLGKEHMHLKTVFKAIQSNAPFVLFHPALNRLSTC